MGTTRSMIFVQNRDFTQGELGLIIKQLDSKEKQKDQEFLSMLKGFMTPEMASKMESEYGQMQSPFTNLPHQDAPKAVLAYCESQRWLPLFIESLCDGYTVSSTDLKTLSQQFNTPVFGFAIYDSDVLFVSYCDAQKDIAYDHAKPNFQGFEEYDSHLYTQDFPTFMLDLCDASRHEELLAAWNEEDMVFADDRLDKIADLLDFKLFYDFSCDLPGFQAITAE